MQSFSQEPTLPWDIDSDYNPIAHQDRPFQAGEELFAFEVARTPAAIDIGELIFIDAGNHAHREVDSVLPVVVGKTYEKRHDTNKRIDWTHGFSGFNANQPDDVIFGYSEVVIDTRASGLEVVHREIDRLEAELTFDIPVDMISLEEEFIRALGSGSRIVWVFPEI